MISLAPSIAFGVDFVLFSGNPQLLRKLRSFSCLMHLRLQSLFFFRSFCSGETVFEGRLSSLPTILVLFGVPRAESVSMLSHSQSEKKLMAVPAFGVSVAAGGEPKRGWARSGGSTGREAGLARLAQHTKVPF